MVLLKNLSLPLPSKKFPTFYGTYRFITVFADAHDLPPPWARWIQSTKSHPISFRAIYNYSPRSSNEDSFLQISPVTSYVHFSSPHCLLHVTHPTHIILLDLIILIMTGMVYKMKFLMTQFSTPSFHFLLHAQYLPQHPTLNHLSLCSSSNVRSSFTPIQNNRHNYRPLYFNPQVFR